MKIVVDRYGNRLSKGDLVAFIGFTVKAETSLPNDYHVNYWKKVWEYELAGTPSEHRLCLLENIRSNNDWNYIWLDVKVLTNKFKHVTAINLVLRPEEVCLVVPE